MSEHRLDQNERSAVRKRMGVTMAKSCGSCAHSRTKANEVGDEELDCVRVYRHHFFVQPGEVCHAHVSQISK